MNNSVNNNAIEFWFLFSSILWPYPKDCSFGCVFFLLVIDWGGSFTFCSFGYANVYFPGKLVLNCLSSFLRYFNILTFLFCWCFCFRQKRKSPTAFGSMDFIYLYIFCKPSFYSPIFYSDVIATESAPLFAHVTQYFAYE